MAFSYMFLVEGWGTGIPKMYEMAKAFGLKEPEIIAQGNSFKVNLFKKENIDGETKDVSKYDPKVAPKNTSQKITDRQSSILDLLATNEPLTRKEMTQRLGLSDSTIKRELAYLKEKGFIGREGGKTNGRWVIINR